MIAAGLEGMPCRIFRAQARYDDPAWDLGGGLTGIGGTLMFLGMLLFFYVIAMTIFVGRKGEAPEDIPWSETLTAPALSGFQPRLDQLRLWSIVAIVLILIAYGPFFVTYLPPNLASPGYKPC
jgi:cytochrome c oxidase subunit 1